MTSVAIPHERAAARTRQRILDVAFEQIHHHGFQGLRIDAVLSSAGLTKGAFYHHFPSKQALGYAVIDEVIADRIKMVWFDTLSGSDDPITAVGQAFEKAVEICGPEMFLLGCPLNNLAQEMSPIDEGFRTRTERIFTQWRNAIKDALERGKKASNIRQDLDSDSAAAFIVACIEGCIGLSKNGRDKIVFMKCVIQLDHYLETLRP